MKTHQKIYLGVTGAILTTLLIVPSLAASNHTPAPAGDPVKVEKPAPVAVKVEKPAPVPVKVASVSTTGFGFSAAANDLKMTVDQVLEIVTDDNLRKDDRSR
nr:hypothetical protein [Nitrospinaceae bacterium]NIR55017.1 hypothetical protein [Nitrospinaceae bacterium]NIS85416.1 hypothetical protein [Nitrospinaceae bacterium]NIT82255.1 hypothetical protein [Nitrospinaceae bacterium]NIU44485.1 hypothetical protein [Nitrospinaceae bacterium]